MKNYKTPELEIMNIAVVGDIITYSENGRLGVIGADINEDGQTW